MQILKGLLLTIAMCGFFTLHLADVHGEEKVLAVESTERILVEYKRLPVYLSLAHLDFPSDEALNKQAIDRLGELLNGKGVDVLFEDDYGANDAGAPLVYLRQGQVFVNVILVGEGLARYKPSANPNSYERLLANAARMAERNKAGMFAEAGADTQPANAQPAKQPPAAAPVRAKPAKKKAKIGERFASELNGRYYYPENHPAMRKVHRNRIIYYNDEESARAAGKQRAPEVNQSALPVDDGTVKAAEKVFELGESMMGKAQAMPATPERDRAYTEVLQVLTEAVQRFSALMEKKPNDEVLGEKLRRAMQLRYGAMKMRQCNPRRSQPDYLNTTVSELQMINVLNFPLLQPLVCVFFAGCAGGTTKPRPVSIKVHRLKPPMSRGTSFIIFRQMATYELG